MLVDELLTTGARASSDNVVMVNCSINFMRMAKDVLTNNNECKAINVVLNPSIKENVTKLLDMVPNTDHQKIYARTFVASMIMLEILKNYDNIKLGFEYTLEDISHGIRAFLSGDLFSVKEYHIQHAPWSMDIERIVRKYGKMELNIFLIGKIDRRIQHEINEYIFSRLPYCVKIFTNEERLSSYHTSFDGVIQTPHDYIGYDMMKLNPDHAV